MTPLLPILALLSAHASTVVLDGARYRELVDAPLPDRVDPLPPIVATRDVRIAPRADGAQVDAEWTLTALAPGWVTFRVAGPELRIDTATLDGQPAPLVAGPQGTTFTAWIAADARLVVRGTVVGEPAQGVALTLGEAVRGTVTIEDDGRRPVLTAGARPAVRVDGAFSTAAEGLVVTWADRAPLAEKPPLYVADVTVGLTVGDGEVTGRAHLEWHLRQGELRDTAVVRVRGAGPHVTVRGDNVTAHQWRGDTLVLTLSRPVRDLLAVDLAWSVPVPPGEEARVSVPTLEAVGAFRTDAALQLAREDEIEVVPELSGWRPVPMSDMPKLVDGLVTGTKTASWRGAAAAGGSLSVLRVVPADQPPVVVDVSSTTLALNDEGRVLMRGYFTVRNERAAALRVVPPPGVRMIAVQVSGKPVTPGQDGEPGWLIPLPRSLETLEGSLSFPVEVVAFGTLDAWSRKEQRDVALFTVDAPVAVQRTTVHLPPGYAPLGEVGEQDRVADFTEGETLSYGMAVGDVAAAEVDTRFQEALDAWMDNDFDAAQAKLDELRDMGGESENVRKLQSNLDIVDVEQEIGVAEAEEDTTVARRVKGMAQARAVDEEAKREEALQSAREAERAGDYEKAAAEYGSALAIGERLAGLEQTESAEVRSANAAVYKDLEEVDKKAKAKTRGPTGSGGLSAIGGREVHIVAGEASPTSSMSRGAAGRTRPDLMPPEDPAPTVIDGRVPLVLLGEGEVSGLLRWDQPAAFLPPPDDGNVLDELVDAPSFDLGELRVEPEDLALSNELVGAEGYAYGYGGLGVSGVGSGGGGTGESVGFGTISTRGYGSGASGYGSGRGAVPDPKPTARPAQRAPAGPQRDADRVDPAPEPTSGDAYRPVSRTTVASESHGRAARGGSIASLGTLGRRMVEAPPPMESPLDAISFGGEESEEPVVTASSMSIVVPSLGETVRFQRVLLPAEATPTVHLNAKKTSP